MSNLTPYRQNRLASRPFSLFGDDFLRPFFTPEAWNNNFRVDVKDVGDSYLLEADLPGMKREDVHIDVEDGVLTISCEVDDAKKEEKDNYVYNERRYDKMQRSFTLNGIDEGKITAEYENGVLKLKMPKLAETTKTGRRIEIQ